MTAIKPDFTLNIVPQNSEDLEKIKEFLENSDLEISNIELILTKDNIKDYLNGNRNFLTAIYYFAPDANNDDVIEWMASNVWKEEIEAKGLTVEEFLSRRQLIAAETTADLLN